jgi:plasmid maintenance system antidote protein VapI/Zn-dependent peptidase ImmA (M78 family)
MSTKERYAYEPDYAVAPGETLQEVIEARGMSQKDLAVRTGLTPQTVVRIIKGEQPITYTTANLLELSTGVPARFWNNLEAQYRERLAKLDERERMRADLDWLKTVPVKELQSRGLVGVHKDQVLVLRDVFAFYGVSSVAAWREVWETPAVAARRSKCFETCPGPASAWIRQGELQAQGIECEPYDKARFLEALTVIRGLTGEKAEVFRPKMVELCAQTGVAVVFVPEMKKVPWNGAMKWLAPDKVMILLSLRGKREDKFWFSFYHESGHVVRAHSKRELFINDGTSEDEFEEEADAFASEFMIPHKHDQSIAAMRSEDDIIALSEFLGISRGIVAGRFQFLTKKWSHYRGLIRGFEWNSTAKQV